MRVTENRLAQLARDRNSRVLVYTDYQGVSGLGGRHAVGTSNARRGLTLVGEQGPELVEMSGGEKVHTAAMTARMLNGSNGNGGTVNNYYYAPAGYSNRGVTNATRRYARIQGPS